MDVPFSEWTREEKDEYAQKRMEQMKLRNEQFKLRHAEVEQDRIKAEAKNSSVTSSKSLNKEKSILHRDNDKANDFIPKPREREWDRGKCSLDVDWKPHVSNRQQLNWKNYSDQRSGKKQENWRHRSPNANWDPQADSSRAFGKSWSNRKYSETSNQGVYNNRNNNYVKQKGKDYSTGNNSFKAFQSSKLDESRKKTYVGASGSASQSPSDSEMNQIKQPSKNETNKMWQIEGSNEVQHRRSRVEKWVKSINTPDPDDDDSLVDLNQELEYHNKKWPEYNCGFADDASKEYKSAPVFSVDNKKYHDVKKANPQQNTQGRTNVFQANDKKFGDSKSQKEGKRKVYGSKRKPRRESDTSDRVSSAKESDYPSYKNEKCEKIPDSISDHSGIWEGYTYSDDVCRMCYLPLQSSNTFPDKVDENKKTNDFKKCTITSNKQWKNKSYSRNWSSSDYSETNENLDVKKQSDRRSNWKRSEGHTLKRSKFAGNRLKTEFKPSDSSTFENYVPLVESQKSSLDCDPSILVKIESHTVKRTFFNNNFTSMDTVQCKSPNELVAYSQKECEEDANVSENMQPEGIESCGWGDYDYGDDYENLNPLQQKDCDHSEFVLEYNPMEYEDLDRVEYVNEKGISSSNNNDSQNIKDDLAVEISSAGTIEVLSEQADEESSLQEIEIVYEHIVGKLVVNPIGQTENNNNNLDCTSGHNAVQLVDRDEFVDKKGISSSDKELQGVEIVSEQAHGNFSVERVKKPTEQAFEVAISSGQDVELSTKLSVEKSAEHNAEGGETSTSQGVEEFANHSVQGADTSTVQSNVPAAKDLLSVSKNCELLN